MAWHCTLEPRALASALTERRPVRPGSAGDFAGASEQLELQARTMLGLDRRLRGFDARFRSLEKAVTSAAELAAASARCGQDGAEAATAAAAAVRVEAEARCRELAKRIDGILEKDLEAQVDSIVQKCLGKDFQSVQRRLSQLEKLSKEMEESGPKIAAHEATRTHEERGALERRLCAAELAVEGLHGLVGKPLEERMSKLEAEIARLRAPERVAVMQDPAARTAAMRASGDGKGLEQERLTLVIPDFDECRSTSPAPSAASSPSPSKLRAVPFQQQRRPSRSAPGARPEAPVAIVTPDKECQVAVRRAGRARHRLGAHGARCIVGDGITRTRITRIARPMSSGSAMFRVLVAALLALGRASLIAYFGSGCLEGETCETRAEVRAVDVLSDGGIIPNPRLNFEVDGLPVWLTVKESPEEKCLFVALDRVGTGSIQVYVDRGSSLDRFQLVQSVESAAPVFAALSQDQRHLVVANSGSGGSGASVAAFEISAGCALHAADLAPHLGSSVHPGQLSAHPLGLVVSHRIFAFDLGMDAIVSYKLEDGKFADAVRTQVPPGLGPRRGVQHPNLPLLYVLCELGQSILIYQEHAGNLRLLQMVALTDEEGKAGDILISDSGNTIYATNRGDKKEANTVSVFSVLENGHLKAVQKVPAPAYPGGISLVYDSVLLVTGQADSNIAIYAIEGEGKLKQTYTAQMGLPRNPSAILVLHEPSGEL
ncbi:unnamed protein product [Effrenium voratum]|nr:unnamed protein product [Effrenium voratum]